MREWRVLSRGSDGKTGAGRVRAHVLTLEDGALVFRDRDLIVVQAFAPGAWIETDRVDEGREREKKQ